ncbi:unnamed protein product [Lepeophtheirus salmonis]|uniref:(salmon louse) hypothetical protein n=2 Tax=Lepeophtheirus salmonis TaxID=72036 RepID=A0A7R8CU18_LEPSM|nr:unnamed protein product [Lepeophtheirus salmonis]CAF2931578.1 unnamed protein product [Lepeophtheirus salmonis]
MLEAMKRKFENFGVESLEIKWPQSYPNHSQCQHSYDDDEAVKHTKEADKDRGEEKVENSESETSSSTTESFVEVHEEEDEEEGAGEGNEDELSRPYSFNHVTFSSDIEFLKEKHSRLLSDLHREIDELRRKNRELQYKLVMRESSPEPSRPSSSDKLRRTIQDLQADLIKVQSHNKLLSKLLEEQKDIKDLQERGANPFKSLPRLENRATPLPSQVDPKSGSIITSSVSLESLRRLETVYLRRMEEAEGRIFLLQKENQEQRNELLDLKAEIFKANKLKYRGCNHPSRLRSFSNPKSSLDNLSSLQLLARPKRSRTESLDRFQALPPFKSRSRSGLGYELPPVPGSSGSESSSSMNSSSKQPINLIALKPSQSVRADTTDNQILPHFMNKKLKKSKTNPL